MKKRKKNVEKDLPLVDEYNAPTLPNSDEPERPAVEVQQEVKHPPRPAYKEPVKMKAPKKKETPRDDGLPKVDLRVFIASGGIRWDQMAGFKSYATRRKMGPLSIPEWRTEYKRFTERPV
jgi:hypothetical protein